MARENLEFCCYRVKLIQQTPYIHFQHDQDGAILRATEVKPKLDTFIRRKMEEKGEKIPENWLIKTDGSTEALNYKMRFRVTGEPEKSEAAKYEIEAYDWGCKEAEAKKNHNDTQEETYNENRKTAERAMRNEINWMYFGNMVEKQKKVGNDRVDKTPKEYEADVHAKFKETVFYKDPIEMTILCMIPGLLEMIKSVLDEFFLLYNFGCRQTKGFGGFVTESILNMNCVKAYGEMKNRPFFYAVARIPTNADAKKKYGILLNHAMTLYAIMKGGLNLTQNNHPERYIKGYIQRQYLDIRSGTQKVYGCEKPYIKRQILKLKRDDGRDKTRYTGGFTFVRALLGLADHYEYKCLDYGQEIKKTIDVRHETDAGHEKIARFPSPITIKIIGAQIFFLFDVEAVQPILNQTFSFVLRTDDENNQGDTDNPPKSIPTMSMFDQRSTVNFMKNFVEFFNSGIGDRPAAKETLKLFGYPYNNTGSLTLKMGGIQK